jgi:hypothetical protein
VETFLTFAIACLASALVFMSGLMVKMPREIKPKSATFTQGLTHIRSSRALLSILKGKMRATLMRKCDFTFYLARNVPNFNAILISECSLIDF